MWNPAVYLAYADHRARPFYDLLARVGAPAPRRIADLGCGPGNLTADLATRWPEAVIEAWDSSAEMVAAARERGVDARVGDVRDWAPASDTDVVISNATLHWVPEHPDLLVRWAAQLGAGAWIAVQVPGNFDAPSHTAVQELAHRPQWAELLPCATSSAMRVRRTLTSANSAMTKKPFARTSRKTMKIRIRSDVRPLIMTPLSVG